MDFSQATRNLCAGTYLDSEFARRVLLGAYADRGRYIAPSHGFDLPTVALHARRAWWIDALQHVVLLAAIIALTPSVVALVIAGCALVTWHIVQELARLVVGFLRYLRDLRSISDLAAFWVRAYVIFLKFAVAAGVAALVLFIGMGPDAVATLWRDNSDIGPMAHLLGEVIGVVLLLALVVLVADVGRQLALRAMLADGAGTEQRRNRRMRHLAVEQSSEIIYYSGYRPFVGSGEAVTTWSLALRLLEKDQQLARAVTARGRASKRWVVPRPRTESQREVDSLSFGSAKLMERIRAELERLGTLTDAESRLPGLRISDRVFVVETHARHIPVDRDVAIRRARDDPTGPARHYLACTVEGWGGEIVTSVFVNASLQGRTLYLEFAVYALLPVRPDFHVGEHAGDKLAAWHVRRILRRLGNLPEEVRRLPGDLLTAVPFAAKTVASLGRVAPRRKARAPGTRYSVREDAAISQYVATVAAQRPDDRVGRRHRDVLLIEEADPHAERQALEAVREAERLTRQAGRAVNYFQLWDILRHWKVIERRVTAAVLDFLDDNGIDTGEYRGRMTQILNNYGNFFAGPVTGAHFGPGDVNVTHQGDATNDGGGGN